MTIGSGPMNKAVETGTGWSSAFRLDMSIWTEQLDKDQGGVVASVAPERIGKKAIDGCLGRGILGLEIILAQRTRKTVGAQQNPVARPEPDPSGVDHRLGVGAERMRHDIGLGVPFRGCR